VKKTIPPTVVIRAAPAGKNIGRCRCHYDCIRCMAGGEGANSKKIKREALFPYALKIFRLFSSLAMCFAFKIRYYLVSVKHGDIITDHDFLLSS
jgi:hypothetical protein